MSRRRVNVLLLAVFFSNILHHHCNAQQLDRFRARKAGIVIGILKAGEYNAITDVVGVKVGHTTIIAGDSIRTGVTAILPHDANVFQEKVPAAIYLGNAFGKLAGSTQVEELGEIETPIILTNTLSVPTAMNAVLEYLLGDPANERVQSINPVVGETNDGWLNDIRGRHVQIDHVIRAITSAKDGPVQEGTVGAGTGTTCFGFKSGIGTASRVLPNSRGGYTVGVLVQTNFGGILQINGAPVGRELNSYSFQKDVSSQEEGSCMIVVATDAPLLSRNLKRLAKRAILGIAKTGGFCANGSGDYVIAFSTNKKVRINYGAPPTPKSMEILPNNAMSALFLAVVEATEEAIINSLFMANTLKGRRDHSAEAIPLDKVLDVCKKYNVLHWNETLPPHRTSNE